MRKVLVSIAAVGVALAATPSLAQSYGNPGGGYNQGGYGQPGYNDRRATPSPYQIRDLVEQAIRSGRVDRREARDLRDDVKDLIKLDRRAQRDGYRWGDRRQIDQRSNDILGRLRNSGPGYGRGPNGPQGQWRDPQGGGYPPQPQPNRYGN